MLVNHGLFDLRHAVLGTKRVVGLDQPASNDSGHSLPQIQGHWGLDYTIAIVIPISTVIRSFNLSSRSEARDLLFPLTTTRADSDRQTAALGMTIRKARHCHSRALPLDAVDELHPRTTSTDK
jgi:hypothetical protein